MSEQQKVIPYKWSPEGMRVCKNDPRPLTFVREEVYRALEQENARLEDEAKMLRLENVAWEEGANRDREKIARLEAAARHLWTCEFAGTEIEFRCPRCVEAVNLLDGTYDRLAALTEEEK